MNQKSRADNPGGHVKMDRYYISVTGMTDEMTTVKADIEPILER